MYGVGAFKVAKSHAPLHLFNQSWEPSPVGHICPGRVPRLAGVLNAASGNEKQLVCLPNGILVERAELDRTKRVFNLHTEICQRLWIRIDESNQRLSSRSINSHQARFFRG